MTPIVSVRDLEISFRSAEGSVKAVRGVSFDIPRKRTLAVVGESGSGKSVVAQAILGILPAVASVDRGSIVLDDKDIGSPPVDLLSLDPDDERRRAVRGARISIIFQEPMSSLSPVHTIGDQISEALIQHRPEERANARKKTIDMLDLAGFPRPQRSFESYPFELSGGLRQRAMIAMALVCRPALLIADEPTTALDVTIQAQILKLMRDLQAELGMAILFITHDLGIVANMADETVVLYRGRVMERGSTKDLLEEPRHPYLRSLLRAVPRLNTPKGERLMGLRDVSIDADSIRRRDDPKRSGAMGSDVILEVAGVRKVFRVPGKGWLKDDAHEVVAADDIGFSIERGRCMAIVGESGSGKTTVSRIIMRAVEPDAGRVVFRGPEGDVDILALGEDDLARFRRRLQYVFQDPFGSLNPRMTVMDIIAEPLVIHGIGSEQERIERVRTLLDMVGLDRRHLHRYPHSFSGGQRQRIGIARALALEPDLLICDEPVSALDVSVQAQILNLLKDLQAAMGLTYLFISHNLAVVKYVADKIAVMCAGRIVERASTADLFASPQHPYTRALLSAVPEPEIGAKLDLSALMAGKASDPEAWPPPYGLLNSSGVLEEFGVNHFVRVER